MCEDAQKEGESLRGVKWTSDGAGSGHVGGEEALTLTTMTNAQWSSGRQVVSQYGGTVLVVTTGHSASNVQLLDCSPKEPLSVLSQTLATLSTLLLLLGRQHFPPMSPKVSVSVFG